MPDTLTPDTRKEKFYKGILDRDASDLPDPDTREELWLKEIAESGGSSGAIYLHSVNMSNLSISFTTFTDFNTAFTEASLKTYLTGIGAVDLTHFLSCNGSHIVGGAISLLVEGIINDNGTLKAVTKTISDGAVSLTTISGIIVIRDIVSEI